MWNTGALVMFCSFFIPEDPLYRSKSLYGLLYYQKVIENWGRMKQRANTGSIIDWGWEKCAFINKETVSDSFICKEHAPDGK